MTGGEILTQLLGLFSQEIPQADFRRGYLPGPAGRRPERPAVVGEVDSETVTAGSREIRLKWGIFLPESQSSTLAEELFTQMCGLARESVPGFSAVSRGAVVRDGVTGLLEVPCVFTLVESSASGGGAVEIVLGGRTLTASSVKTGLAWHGQDLIAIGEEEPFARQGEWAEYTVELEGLETLGLERLAAFTAVIGDARYENCRWKSLCAGKAVFQSAGRSLTGGEAP